MNEAKWYEIFEANDIINTDEQFECSCENTNSYK